MFAHNIISIIFRGINLAIFFGASVYLFQRYALGFIKRQIAKRQQDFQLLQEHAYTLDAQKKESEQKIVDQQFLFTVLTQRAKQWNAAFNLKMNEREQEKEAIKSYLQKKIIHQQNYIAVQHAKQIILPVAIERARTELIKSFEPEEEGTKFVDSLVSYMSKASKKSRA